MYDRQRPTDQYTEWRGPDKPGQPGVHVVGYVVILGAAVAVGGTLWWLL